MLEMFVLLQREEEDEDRGGGGAGGRERMSHMSHILGHRGQGDLGPALSGCSRPSGQDRNHHLDHSFILCYFKDTILREAVSSIDSVNNT